uniref:Uncharacterized protein n=1 Tax=Ditylenchus dipsaci TaxID=166011 RepID=A0A915D2K4_9BILA
MAALTAAHVKNISVVEAMSREIANGKGSVLQKFRRALKIRDERVVNALIAKLPFADLCQTTIGELSMLPEDIEKKVYQRFK